MYKEVAFDPRCMSDIEYYNLIKQHFGFAKGRYISAELRPWAREAMTHAKASNLKPVRKKSIKNYLNKLGRMRTSKEFLLTEDRRNVEANSWSEWFQLQKVIRDFPCVVAEAGSENCIGIDHINDGCDQWTVPQSISVPRTAPKIIGALYPLLTISLHVTIIDQYFRISTNRSLIELFKAIAGTSVQSLRIVTSVSSADAVNVYEREYRALNTTSAKVELLNVPLGYFHDRYLISDVGAVRSGQGFMEDVEKGTHADLANINIIEFDEVARTMDMLRTLKEDGRANLELSV